MLKASLRDVAKTCNGSKIAFPFLQIVPWDDDIKQI